MRGLAKGVSSDVVGLGVGTDRPTDPPPLSSGDTVMLGVGCRFPHLNLSASRRRPHPLFAAQCTAHRSRPEKATAPPRWTSHAGTTTGSRPSCSQRPSMSRSRWMSPCRSSCSAPLPSAATSGPAESSKPTGTPDETGSGGASANHAA